MGNQVSFHENYDEDEATEAGSNRAFGCTVGSILMAIGAIKTLMTGALLLIALLIFVTGAMLLLLGIVAPSRLSMLKKLWLRIGAAIARLVNPIVLALLFFFFVTPMALFMRIVGKRPLRLVPDPAAATYWIERERSTSGSSSMRRQF